MSTEITVTCDGCGEPITSEQQHIRVVAQEVDTGAGITSAPAQKDYHPEHVPEPVTVATGFELDSLIVEADG